MFRLCCGGGQRKASVSATSSTPPSAASGAKPITTTKATAGASQSASAAGGDEAQADDVVAIFLELGQIDAGAADCHLIQRRGERVHQRIPRARPTAVMALMKTGNSRPRGKRFIQENAPRVCPNVNMRQTASAGVEGNSRIRPTNASTHNMRPAM